MKQRQPKKWQVQMDDYYSVEFVIMATVFGFLCGCAVMFVAIITPLGM